jgi:CRP-like cAMP-binding protein
MQNSAISQTYRNSVLASLSPPVMERLAAHLVPVTLKRSQTLHDAGQTVETIFFLEEGICSVVVSMEDGATVEVGIIGRDSFVGLPAVLGTGHSSNRSFIQLPGSGYSLRMSVLHEHLCEPSGELRTWLYRGVQGLLTQTAQSAACNRVHEVEQRLARWLLMCHDRVQADQLTITHEFLAMMLGTRRSTVTTAAGMLHKSGVIEYSRGRVTIRSLEGLKEAACECYAIVHDEYVRLKLL